MRGEAGWLQEGTKVGRLAWALLNLAGWPQLPKKQRKRQPLLEVGPGVLGLRPQEGTKMGPVELSWLAAVCKEAEEEAVFARLGRVF